jgi:hypothetical protein
VGIFGSIGRALGGAVKGLTKVATFGLKSGLLPIPFGGTAGRLVGGLLHAKAPGGHSALKLRLPTITLRAKSASMRPITAGAVRIPTATQLRRSPVMPGGAVATRGGVANRPAVAPMSLGGAGSSRSGGTTRRRKKRSASTARRSRRSSARRRTGRRKLKFGSPAWRKKYLGHGRKKRRRKSRAA